jgi:hypothetical protein
MIERYRMPGPNDPIGYLVRLAVITYTSEITYYISLSYIEGLADAVPLVLTVYFRINNA